MLHRQACCVPPGSKAVQVPRGRESSRNRDQARAPRSQRWQQPQTRGTPSPPPQVTLGRLARQGPREQAAPASPPLGQSRTTGPTNASHPKRSRRLSVPHDRPQQRLPPKEKQTLISQHLCKPKSLRKGGGRLRPPLGSSLQRGQGAAACGTQHTSS